MHNIQFSARNKYIHSVLKHNCSKNYFVTGKMLKDIIIITKLKELLTMHNI